MRTVAYYKGCLASLSAKELDIATQALAPKVGLAVAGSTSLLTEMAGFRVPIESHLLQAFDVRPNNPDLRIGLPVRIVLDRRSESAALIDAVPA